MTYKLSAPGWFSNVNGFSVNKHALPSSIMDHAGEFFGHHGIEWHRQQGTNDDIYQTEVARGYPIATWSVGDGGEIFQYNDFRIADWHGDSVSHYAFGIEHQGFTGTPCPDKQLDASAALCAAIVEVTEDLWGDVIPLTKVPRVSVSNYTTVKGFWDHTDVDNGPLNENGHSDHLEGRSWGTQLKKIGSFLVPAKPAPTFHGTLLKVGVEAPDVIVWKRRMAARGLFSKRDTNDGPHYGKSIEQATKVFQARKKLTEDGVVGPKTWNAAW
jgi:peptidoglycan hydrolase-like protein with peptidoglycan-binding domain